MQCTIERRDVPYLLQTLVNSDLEARNPNVIHIYMYYQNASQASGLTWLIPLNHLLSVKIPKILEIDLSLLCSWPKSCLSNPPTIRAFRAAHVSTNFPANQNAV